MALDLQKARPDSGLIAILPFEPGTAISDWIANWVSQETEHAVAGLYILRSTTIVVWRRHHDTHVGNASSPFYNR